MLEQIADVGMLFGQSLQEQAAALSNISFESEG